MSEDKQLVTLKYTTDYQDLLRKAGTFGQSSYSDENFLVKDQHTPHRKLRQVLMHYDGVCYTLLNHQNKKEQAKIEKEEIQNKIDELNDAINRNQTLGTKLEASRDMTIFDKKAYQLKIRKLKTKLRQKEIGEAQSHKLVEDALNSKENYEKILSELIPQVEALEAKGIDFDKAETIYWRRRFTEEAKLDIFIKKNNIPINKETIKSILKLDTDARKETFKALNVPENLAVELGIDWEQENKLLLSNDTQEYLEEK